MVMRNLSDALKNIFDDSISLAINDIQKEIKWSKSEIHDIKNTKTEKAVFLTISGHQFRLFVIIHYIDTEMASFVKQCLGIKANDALTEQDSIDYIYEFGNSLCGIIKRELGNGIRALGMSTPNLLHRQSVDLMESFNITAQGFRKIDVAAKAAFYLSFHLVPDVKEDIQIEINEHASVDSGELELF